jgi:hypothetical protein
MKKIFLANACIFFFSFTLLVLLVFLSGNFQGFTARSLFLLLDILKSSSFLCLLAGIAYLSWLIRAALKKRFYPLPLPLDFGFAALCLLFGLSILLVSQFIIVVTMPKF